MKVLYLSIYIRYFLIDNILSSYIYFIVYIYLSYYISNTIVCFVVLTQPRRNFPSWLSRVWFCRWVRATKYTCRYMIP